MVDANKFKIMTERLIQKFGSKCTIIRKTEQFYDETSNTYKYETTNIETFYVTKSDKVLLIALNKTMSNNVTISEGKEQIVVLSRNITIQDEVLFNDQLYGILDVKNVKYKDETIVQILTITKI